MAVDRSEFQIKVSTTADLAGMVATIETMKRLRDQVAAAGGDTSAYTAAIEQKGAAYADLVKKLKEGAHGAGEAFEVEGHTVKHAIHLIGEAAGEVAPQLGPIGHLAGMVSSPEFMVPAAALIAWKMLGDMMDKVIEQQQKIIEWNRQSKESAIEASAEAVRGIRAEQDAFALRLKHQMDGENELKRVLAERLAMFGAELDHTHALQAADSERFTAYVAYLVKIGRMTPEQAEAATNARKQFDADQKEKGEERKAQAAIDAKKTEREQASQQMADDPAKLAAAEAAKRVADTAAKKNTKDIAQEQSKYEEMDATAKEAEAKWIKVQEIAKGVAHPGSIGEFAAATKAAIEMKLQGDDISSPADMDRMIRDAKGTLAAAEQQKGHVERMQDHQTELDSNVATAAADVKKWQDQIAEARKAFKELTDAISQATLELAQKKSDYAQERGEHIRAAQAEQFYNHPHPLDAESHRNINLPALGPGTSTAVDQVTREVSEQARMHRAGMADPAAVHAAIEHIVSIFASHAELTQQMQESLLRGEQRMRDIETQLHVNNNSTSL